MIVNGWKLLTTITKHSILDAAAALDPPMELWICLNLLKKFWTKTFTSWAVTTQSDTSKKIKFYLDSVLKKFKNKPVRSLVFPIGILQIFHSISRNMLVRKDPVNCTFISNAAQLMREIPIPISFIFKFVREIKCTSFWIAKTVCCWASVKKLSRKKSCKTHSKIPMIESSFC